MIGRILPYTHLFAITIISHFRCVTSPASLNIIIVYNEIRNPFPIQVGHRRASGRNFSESLFWPCSFKIIAIAREFELGSRKFSSRQEKVICTHKRRVGAFNLAEIMIPVHEPRCLS